MLEHSNTLAADLDTPTKRYIQERLHACRGERDGRVLRRALQIPFLEMPMPAWDPDVFLNEAWALREHFVDHRSSDSEGWKSLCLHGLEEGKTLAFDRYGYANEKVTPYRWTKISERAPATARWVKSLLDEEYFVELYRVRWMWLKPGGFIRFHRDRPAEQKALGPLNIALNMPDGCHWLFKEWGSVPFRAGSTFAVDISNEHGVWNDSREDRIHIIVHGLYGPRYYDGIVRSVAGRLASVGQNV